MKRIIIILSYFIVAIIFCLIGFFIGVNVNKENKDDQITKAVGVYNNKNWNNREATLMLNEDFSCQYPGGSKDCTWSINGKEIIIQLPSSSIDDGKHIATLSDNGIVLHEHFFVKVG